MSHPHEGEDAPGARGHAHHGHAAHAAPAEPGYPEHPELTQDVGASRAAHAGRVGHPAPAGHDAHAGHDKHAGHSVAMFRDKFWLSLALTIPILVWGHMLPRAFGYTPPMFPGAHWIAPVLGIVVFFYGGWPFVQGAVHEIRDRLPGMMTLITL
ncbi:MAG TPA: hypothetical protein VEA99_14630, partial [Gemmatimonadaceae bacterium]|nr:hypothetical protein [Gemmatimonadaceae bacterium]